MATMCCAQIKQANSQFEIINKDIPKPDAQQVRVKVHACGVCHSDVLTQNGQWPGLHYPRCPGHEVAGVIDEIGSATPPIWQKGQRVGVGWNGGYCNACRHGDFIDWVITLCSSNTMGVRVAIAKRLQ